MNRFQYGSTWVKADFHLHTIKDKEFEYINNTEYPDENVFPKEYIAALKKAGIGLGVITNHNKFNKGEFDCLRKHGKREDIYLLPGTELYISGGSEGIHILVVFSDDWISEEDYISKFIDSLFPGVSRTQVHNETRSKFSLEQMVGMLDDYHKDYFLVFAHANSSHGIFDTMKIGTAMQTIKTIAATGTGESRIFAFQKLNEETSKVFTQHGLSTPARVEGSDPKAIDSVGQGNKQCWVKIGCANFDAVKLAIAEHETRILLTPPPSITHSHVKSVSFDGGFLSGTQLSFSAELNNLIGIRGSGKSAILEMIRYALEIPLPDKIEDGTYKAELVKHAIGSGGRVTVLVSNELGNEYKINRTFNRSSEVLVNDEIVPNLKSTSVIHRPLFFGQKELTARNEDFYSNLIDRLVGDKLSDIRTRIKEKQNTVRECISKINNLGSLKDEKDFLQTSIAENTLKLTQFDQFNVSEKLSTQTDFNNDERSIRNVKTEFRKYKKILQDTIVSIQELDFSCSLTERNSGFQIQIESITNSAKTILSSLNAAIDKINEILIEIDATISAFSVCKNKSFEEIDEIKRELETQIRASGVMSSINLEEYPALQSKIADAQQRLTEINRKETQKETYCTSLNTALSELSELWREEFRTIQTELGKINGGQGAVKITSEYSMDKNQYMTYMQSVFRGSGLNVSQYTQLTEKYTDFIEMYRNYNNCRNIISGDKIKNAFDKSFHDHIEQLLCYQVPNKYCITYNGKDISTLSLGQRASAMILFILSQQDNDLIIIDQPEDDLDNQTIYHDVIKTLMNVKPSIQFIFATHNANIPVLGDSEMVHCCSASETTEGLTHIIVKSGSLDDHEIRDQIITVMEGGHDAFERRKEIYKLWKHHDQLK